MTVVEVVDAGFAYEHSGIFNNINLKVEKGEVFCMLGPNGCGKTTLIDCILGYNSLNNGKILVAGKDISCFPNGELAHYIAYVPQIHERTFPYRVIDIVLMGRAAYTGRFSAPTQEDREIAKQALEMVGLFELRHRPYTRLSGGEAQMVMIARALAQQTPIIVMDEPTAHLDFKHEMLVLETVMDLVQKNDLTLIMATHFPNHAFYFENYGINTRVALMHNRGFLAIGTPSEVLNESNMLKMYNVDTRLISFHLSEKSQMHQLIPVKTMS